MSKKNRDEKPRLIQFAIFLFSRKEEDVHVLLNLYFRKVFR
jgi:hypothetical protein